MSVTPKYPRKYKEDRDLLRSVTAGELILFIIRSAGAIFRQGLLPRVPLEKGPDQGDQKKIALFTNSFEAFVGCVKYQFRTQFVSVLSRLDMLEVSSSHGIPSGFSL